MQAGIWDFFLKNILSGKFLGLFGAFWGLVLDYGGYFRG
jgi:hypothetical protein